MLHSRLVFFSLSLSLGHPPLFNNRLRDSENGSHLSARLFRKRACLPGAADVRHQPDPVRQARQRPGSHRGGGLQLRGQPADRADGVLPDGGPDGGHPVAAVPAGAAGHGRGSAVHEAALQADPGRPAGRAQRGSAAHHRQLRAESQRGRTVFGFFFWSRHTGWGCLLGGVYVRFIHRMPGGSYRRRLGSLLLWA